VPKSQKGKFQFVIVQNAIIDRYISVETSFSKSITPILDKSSPILSSNTTLSVEFNE
jgi:hypothetical protein